MTRIESASSISTFQQCSRKYFYRYKLQLPEKKGIAAVNGQVVHATLEEFYTFPIETLTENYQQQLKSYLFSCFSKAWVAAIPDLQEVKENKDAIHNYYQESLQMLQNFTELFFERLEKEKQTNSIQQAFTNLKPESEVYILSEKHQLHGYIDAIQKRNGEILILDYKTSRKDDVTDDYKRQLTIYGLLYKQKFGNLPHKVGLYFLRHNREKFMEINEQLIENIEKECAQVHTKTVSEKIEEYPKNLGSWCKWCDYQSVCFGQKSVQEFLQKETISQKI